jgi:ABC-type Fe3+-hydroxamate transport system substrate-binding protein
VTRRGVLITAIVLAGALVLGACDHKEPGALAAAPARRLVVLSPALAGTLRWLGEEKIIVGRHGFDGWSDPSLPVCGDQQGFDYEALIRVNPTDILVEWGERPLPERLVSLAKQRGWTIHNYSTLSLDDVAKTTDDIAALLAERPEPSPAGAGAQARPSDKLKAAWSKRPGPDIASVGRVLLLVSGSPPTALGPGSAHQQILIGLGGKPALESGGPYQTLDVEDVLKIAPDAIVLIVPRTPGSPAEPVTAERLDQVLGPLVRVDVPAVKRGRVVLLDDPEGLLPGAALVRFADALHAALAKWAGAGAAPGDARPAPAGGAP